MHIAPIAIIAAFTILAIAAANAQAAALLGF